MAKLVEIIGVTHNPVLPGILLHRMDEDPALAPARDNLTAIAKARQAR